MNTCIEDISGFQFLSQSQYMTYKEAWNIFNKVENFNSNVSTFKASHPKVLMNYYQFANNTEKNKYNDGLSLHTKYLGPQTVVQQD
jgi:hypothetical protein